MNRALAKRHSKPTQAVAKTGVKLKAWEQRPEETPEEYQMFLRYLFITPIADRSVLNAFRSYLIDENFLLPGQSIPQMFNERLRYWQKVAAVQRWIERANAFDTHQNKLTLATIEEARHDQIAEMIKRHIEGAQAMADMALSSMFQRDDDGNVIFDSDGRPVPRQMRDEASIVRAFKESVNIERTSRNLPAEIYSMSTEEIKRRVLEIKGKLNLTNTDDDGNWIEEPAIEGEIVGTDSDSESE